MAGYTSTPRQYGEYIQPYNIDLIAKALSYKQNKYDIADANLRQEINQIGSLDIMKGVDKSYLLSRLSSMVGDVNNLGALDLSDSGIVKNLDNHISQSVDDKVINAFESTKQIRAFQASMEQLKKDHYEQYNPLNEAYALQPVSEYMKSDKVGESLSSYGSLSYTPYKNIEGDLNKQMMEYVKNMKDGKIKIPGVITKDGTVDYRYMREVDVSGMNLNQIKQLVANTMGSEYDAQARINNWGRYQGYSPQGLAQYRNDVDKVIKMKDEEYSNTIIELKSQLSQVTDKNQDTSELKNKIQQLTLEQKGLGDLKNQMINNPRSAGGLLEREMVIDRISSRFLPLMKKTPDSIIGKNEVYYAELENQYNQNQLKLKEAELDLKRKEDKRKDIELQMKLDGKLDANGNPISPDKDSKPTITPGTSDQLTNPDGTPEEGATNILTSLNDKLKNHTKQAYDYIHTQAELYRNSGGREGSAQAKSIDDAYNQQRGNKHNGALFRQIYLKMAKDQGLISIFDSEGNHIFNKSDLETDLHEFNNASERINKIKNEYIYKARNSILNSQDFVNKLLDGDNLVSLPNGNIYIKDLLKRRGVIDNNGKVIKKLSDDNMIRNTIRANVILNHITYGTPPSNIGFLDHSDFLGKDRRYIKFHDKKYATELGNIYKENISSLMDSNGEISLDKLKKNAPNTYNAYVNFNKEQSIKNRTGNIILDYANKPKMAFKGNSISDLQDANVLSDNKKAYYKALQDVLPNIKVSNNVTFASKSQLENPIAQTLIRQAVGTKGTELSELTAEDVTRLDFNMKDLDSGKNKIDVLVTVGTKSITGKTGTKQIPITLDLESINRDNPNFSKYITDQDRIKTYTNKALKGQGIPTSSDGISFYNPSANFEQVARISDATQKLFKDSPSYPAIVSGLTKDGALKYLGSKFDFRDSSNSVFYSDIMNRSDIDENTRLSLLYKRQKMYIDNLKQALNNSNNMILSAKFINDYKFSISLKDKNGKTISGTIHDGDNLDKIHTLFSDYDSSAFTMFLEDSIEHEKSNLKQGANDFSQDFKNIFNIK